MQAFLRRTSSGDCIEDIGLQFLAIVRSRASRVFCSLGSNKLCWIEFRSSDWEIEHVQSLVRSQKVLHHLALVDWMAIPDQDDRTRYSIKNLLKKSDHLFACEAMP